MFRKQRDSGLSSSSGRVLRWGAKTVGIRNRWDDSNAWCSLARCGGGLHKCLPPSSPPCSHPWALPQKYSAMDLWSGDPRCLLKVYMQCSSIDEWIKKMCYTHTHTHTHTHTGILLSHQKETMPFVATWMHPESITIKGNKSEKDKYHMLSLTCGKWTYLQNKNRLTDFGKKHMVTKGNGGGVGGIN